MGMGISQFVYGMELKPVGMGISQFVCGIGMKPVNGSEYLHAGWEAVCSECGFKEVGHDPEAHPQCDWRPVFLRS